MYIVKDAITPIGPHYPKLSEAMRAGQINACISGDIIEVWHYGKQPGGLFGFAKRRTFQPCEVARTYGANVCPHHE